MFAWTHAYLLAYNRNVVILVQTMVEKETTPELGVFHRPHTTGAYRNTLTVMKVMLCVAYFMYVRRTEKIDLKHKGMCS